MIDASLEAPVLVDFWAPWCGPCRPLTPNIEKVVNEKAGKIRLVKINIDENPAIAGQLGVQSIPAVFAFAGGRPVDAFLGAIPESEVRSFADKVIAAAPVRAQPRRRLDRRTDQERARRRQGGAGRRRPQHAPRRSSAWCCSTSPRMPRRIIGMARVYLKAGEPEQAQAVLDTLPEPQPQGRGLHLARRRAEAAERSGRALGDRRARSRRVARQSRRPSGALRSRRSRSMPRASASRPPSSWSR